MKTTIQTPQAPAAIGPYAQASLGGKLLCVSGQLPINPENGMIPVNLEEQVRQSVKNVIEIVKAAGGSEKNILKCGLFIRDMKEFSRINEAYQEFFKEDPPARFVVEVSALPKGALIEIDAIAII